ncbi:2Fe-2S iron-sulfur cluster-binding protein [Azohydromonas australica]|uniref:2Fe-2S iron-sulfur cluster-binding protein n=1 Tax=Azohydromonas australica TaxID=364039 RepID=UPI000400C14C|nr:2Fe-2S iron-sulfur cluster-binding protein [Azohydromonas australica]
MPHIHYVAADGSRTELQADAGVSIMQAALMRGLPGINADCGGACQCATCHVYVDAAWTSKLPPMEDMEDALLDCTAEPRQPGSRLSCCLTMSAELDGIVVHLPAAQA